MKAQRFFGWLVVTALGVTTCINMGFTNYGGIAVSALMARDMNFDRSILGLGYTVLMLIEGFSAPGVAWAINKAGARITICFASIAMAFGALLLAHVVTQTWHYVLAFGIVMGLGGGFGGNVSAQACAFQWFEKRRGVALSIILGATSIGGFIAAPLLSKIVAATGGNWRMGWDFIAMLGALAGMVSLLFVKNRPADYGQLPDGLQPAEDGAIASSALSGKAKSAPIYRTADNWPVKNAYKTRSLWLVNLASVSTVVAITTLTTHAIPHLQDLGHSVTVAALSLSTIALGGLGGKLLAGFLCDRFEPRYIWFVAMALTAVGVLTSIDARSSAEIYCFALCLGLGYGAALVCWPTMVANYFGAGSFAAIFGVQATITTTVASLAPFLVGLIYKSQASYTSPFIFIASLSLGAGVLLLLAKPPSQHLG